jgi:hypothetical protein
MTNPTKGMVIRSYRQSDCGQNRRRCQIKCRADDAEVTMTSRAAILVCRAGGLYL